MIRLHPFTALRPSFENASEVSSDPYDVISTSGARERAVGKPKSFLHVVRSEIDLPEGTVAMQRMFTKKQVATCRA